MIRFNSAFRRFVSLTMVSSMLSGCLAHTSYQKDIEKTQHRGEAAMSTVPQSGAPVSQNRMPETVAVSDQVYIGIERYKMNSGDQLPTKLLDIRFGKDYPLTLEQFASEFSAEKGIPVWIEPETAGPGGGTQQASAQVPNSLPPPPNGIMGDLSGRGQPPGPAMAAAAPGRAMMINFSGPADVLFNRVAAHFNRAWEFRDGGIRFLAKITRTFPIIVPPLPSKIASSLTNRSENGGDKGTATSTATTVDFKAEDVDVWVELEKKLQSVVGEKGVVISRASRDVTVTGTPSQMSRAAQIIADANETNGRQVTVSVEVLKITKSKNSQLGLDMQAVFESISQRWGASISGPALDTSAGGTVRGNVISNSGRLGQLNGSSIAVQALQSQGDVSSVYKDMNTAMNNTPAPFQDVVQQRIINKIKETTVPNVGVSAETETIVINTGFTLNVLPSVAPGNRVVMHYALTLEDLVDLNPVKVGTGNNQVLLETIATTGRIQNAIMRSGDTLVLGGFERRSVSKDNSGTLDKDFWLFGGGGTASDERTFFVVLVTPVITDSGFGAADTRGAE